eukprot:jgi/Botrbrau1/4439/Bobra.0348s0028.1
MDIKLRKHHVNLAKRHGRGQNPIWISDLPEGVLVKILGLLGSQALMTARLVCSAWRAASIGAITRLFMCHSSEQEVQDGVDPPSLPQDVSYSRPLSPDTLAARLQVLTCVSSLEFFIWDQEDLAVLRIPGCRTLLKYLGLSSSAYNAEEFAGVTQLTGLSLTGQLRPGLVSQCTWLRELYFRNDDGNEAAWVEVLPLVAGLPHLMELGYVPLAREDVVEGVAALTKLTQVWGDDSTCRTLSSLTAIRGLRSLSVGNAHQDGGVLEEFLYSAPQLEQLVLGSTSRGVAVALGSLSNLTCVRLSGDAWPLERRERGKLYKLWCRARSTLDLDRIIPPPVPAGAARHSGAPVPQTT